MASSLKFTWAPIKAGGTPAARSTHTMAADDSHVYLFGGMSTDDQGDPLPLNDMYQLVVDGKPVWRKVRQQGDIPRQREGHTMNTSGKEFILFGGSEEPGSEFNDVYTFDTSSSVWKKAKTQGTPPSPMLNHAAAVVGNALYIYGGFVDGLACKEMHKLDTRFFKWTTVKADDMPVARCNHSMTAIGKKLYVFGGRADESKLFNDIYIFDTETGKWEKPAVKGTKPHPRDFHTATAVGTNLVVFGGAYEVESTDTANYYNDIHVFDTTTNTWKEVKASGPAPAERWSHACALLGNKLYIFGGAAGDEDYQDLHVATIDGAGDGGEPQAPSRGRRPVPARSAPAARAAPKTAPVKAAPRGAAPKAEPTETPTLDYKTPNPAPAARRTVAVGQVPKVGQRDFDSPEKKMLSTISGLFDQIRDEFQQLDQFRAQMAKEKEGFEKEKRENEELFATQQKELQMLKEKLKSETETWLADRKKENDIERQKLADGNTKLKGDQASLKAGQDKLAADEATLRDREVAFDEKSKKLDAIMSQFKGIA